MITDLNSNEVRSICKEKLESLEYWLRRLVNDKLSESFGDYFNYIDNKGNRLIKESVVSSIEKRIEKEPERYSRKVDAILLTDAIEIICNPRFYNTFFKESLKFAFPEGRDEARTFMLRLIDLRHRLAHANPINMHQAEQIICYSGDIIESLKEYYRKDNMNSGYNVPLILKVADSFGNVFFRNQLHDMNGGVFGELQNEPKCNLWPGDTLTIEIEVDPSFNPREYIVKWNPGITFSEPIPNGCKAVLKITTKQICQQLGIGCWVITNNDWHRINGRYDDSLLLFYKVLPLR
jgi:hypothetical protein